MARSSEKEGLLSPEQYDDDASSVPESPTGSSSFTSANPAPPRTSTELPADEDYDILDEEQEREKLLTGSSRVPSEIRGLFGSGKNPHEPVRYSKKERRRDARRKRRRRKRGGDEGEFIYEMEEGGRISESASSTASSSEGDPRLSNRWSAGEKATRRKAGGWKRLLIHVSLFFVFLLLLFAAYRASRSTSSASSEQWLRVLSNGTANFAPTTILISLDGFRADFLYRNLTPTLNSFVAEGVSPEFLLPSFPSLTFPNHFTLATGLYPESHGIVGNTFWDPNTQKEFYYTDPNRSLQPEWWGGEPIWVTAENKGMKSAIHMWPGSEAHLGGVDITHVDKYNGSEMLSVKANRILEFLDLPGPEDEDAPETASRPQLIAAYVPVVDSDGHKYGPNSTEIRKTISDVDEMLQHVLAGLQQRNLSEIVNIVVVSDHGMATTSVNRLLQYEDLVDPDLITHTDGWPLYGLRPQNPKDIKKIYKRLVKKAKKNPHFNVYLRDKNMPARYHFSHNDRIAPIWIVPETGWAIVTRDEMDVQKARKNGDEYHPRGLHGYDHEHPLMRAIFVARGPAFPHTPGSRVDVFQNINVYNIVCDSLGLEPRPNNGTLRLPLKPVGVHSAVGGGETPEDPVSSAEPLSSSTPSKSKPHKPAQTTEAEKAGNADSADDSDDDSGSDGDNDSDSDDDKDGDDDKPQGWWSWIKEKLGKAKAWGSHWAKIGQDAAGDGEGR